MRRRRGRLAGAAPLALAGLAGLATAAACDRRPPPLASCADNLRGIYDAGGRPWMILDDGAGLEAYPLFPDVPPAPGLEVAPRMIALGRAGAPDAISGHVRRRYMRGSRQCVGQAPARVTACAGDAVELVLADPEPPIAWPEATEQPCTWPRLGSSRRERWVRR